MKELNSVTRININKFFQNAKFTDLNLGNFYKAVNSGREKYNDEDLCNYLTSELYEIFANGKKCTNNKLDKMCVMTGGFLYNMLNDNKEIDMSIISRVTTFEGYYKDFCNNNGIEENSQFVKSLKSFTAMIKPEIEQLEKTNDNNETLAKISSENRNLKEEKEKLLKELEKLKKVNSEQEQIIINNSNYLEREEKQAEENKRLNKDLRESAAKRKEAQKAQKKAEEMALELESKNNELINKNNSLEKEKQNLLNEIENFNNSEIVLQAKVEEDLKNFDNKIISMLYEKEYSIQNIIKKLNSYGIKTNMFEVYESLKRIQTKVNVSNSKIITPEQLYRIQAPSVITDNVLLMRPNANDVKDFLFISDLHLQTDSDNFYAYKRMEMIYNYCAENNITDIINLGDVFDTNASIKDITLDNIEKKNVLLDQVKNKLYPVSLFNDIKTSGINHYILGGNHDLDYASMGIDPIDYITKQNLGLISIGYDNAILRFGNNEKSGEYIGLHHCGVPRDEKVNNDHIKSAELTIDFLKKYYEKRSFSYNEDYLDLFGHTHRGKLDSINGYGIIPSLNADRYNDGAWHLKVYFDDNKKIDYILIYPLNVKGDIHIAMELPYKKVRK